jgi:class 3 adenylate cyclase
MADQPNAFRIRFLLTFSVITRILSGVAIGILLLFLFPLVVPYLDRASSYSYIQTALTAERALDAVVEENVPTTIGGRDMSRWFVVAGMFMLSGLFNGWARWSSDKAQFLKFKSTVDAWKTGLHLSENAVVLGPVNDKLEQLKTADRSDRERLLREFADTKRKLDAMGRDLAFLAIDIADSTGMKEGEDRASIEHDFKEYKRLVDRTLKSLGCLKSTWTPDGVMSAFASVDGAVRAAREVMSRLEPFNREVKTMRRDFIVRCGVNAGFVYFDDALPLEEISDRVIDVAGHLQKHAKPNSVCLAKPAIEPLNDRNGFEPAGRVIDGYEIYEWELKRS